MGGAQGVNCKIFFELAFAFFWGELFWEGVWGIFRVLRIAGFWVRICGGVIFFFGWGNREILGQSAISENFLERRI